MCEWPLIKRSGCADVRHQHTQIFTNQVFKTRVDRPYPMVVNVAIDGRQRTESVDAVSQLQRPDIPRMPYLLDGLQKTAHCIVKRTVGVGY